jgi:Cu-Zn family superoxide dismutase
MRFLPLFAGLVLAGCATPHIGSANEGAASKTEAKVFARLMIVQNGATIPVGQAQLVDFGDGMRLYINIDKRPENLFGDVGVHIHAIGKCEAPDFSSAGPHWNPSAKQHGKANPMGHHLGDLGNINVQFGRSIAEMRDISGSRISDLMDEDGASIVIHEKADDNLTDPSGNSGKRMVCGVFERP